MTPIRMPRGFLWPWSCGPDDDPTPAPAPAQAREAPAAPVTPKTIAPSIKPLPRPWQSGFPCVGLCPGDCVACQGLTDRITRAKRLPDGPLREDRLMRLDRAVASFMGRDPEKEA